MHIITVCVPQKHPQLSKWVPEFNYPIPVKMLTSRMSRGPSACRVTGLDIEWVPRGP